MVGKRLLPFSNKLVQLTYKNMKKCFFKNKVAWMSELKKGWDKKRICLRGLTGGVQAVISERVFRSATLSGTTAPKVTEKF